MAFLGEAYRIQRNQSIALSVGTKGVEIKGYPHYKVKGEVGAIPSTFSI